ncbi:NAD(P)-binding domain-containing protein [Streptomyces sp. SID13031]|nr:NAD(P)-binding domain-containing protein [Streptomyces sp. SID13031]
MAVIGFIGSGLVGSAVARRALAAGHQVVMSNSRGTRSLARLVREFGPAARAATPGEAATVADLVVLAIPYGKFPRLPRDELTGRIVLDACNYLPYRDGRDRAIDEGRTSTAEVLAQRLPYSTIVKGLNTIAAGQILADATPPGTPNRRAIPIAGDDIIAKQIVARFIDDLGFDAVDAGPLSGGRGPHFDPRTAWQPPLTAPALAAALT